MQGFAIAVCWLTDDHVPNWDKKKKKVSFPDGVFLPNLMINLFFEVCDWTAPLRDQSCIPHGYTQVPSSGNISGA